MNKKKERFLVTGATGFVGSCLVRELVRLKKQVYVIVRKKELNWRLEEISSKIKIYECDLLDKSLNKIIDEIKPDFIFHLAVYGASSREEDIYKILDVNIKGTLRLIQAVKKHPFTLFINTGSSSEYGVKNRKMNEKDLCEPVNDYGVSKVSATLFCQKIAKKEFLPIITFRLFSPFGYYEDKNRLIPSLILSSLENKSISLSSKNNVRDFIFIEDIVRAYISATKIKINPGEIINIGSGKQKRIKDVAEIIQKITKKKSKLLWNSKKDQSRQIEPKVWKADIKKANKILSWEPKYDLETGLKKTVDWFLHNKYLYE